MPQLILERISSGSIRQIPEREVLDRKLKELQTERLSLFLQLSKENQTRDALVLSSKSERKLKKSLKEENEKIKEIEEKIKENLDNVDKEIKESEEKIRHEEEIKQGKNPENQDDDEKKDFLSEAGKIFHPFALPFFHRDEENKIVEENIAIYKSDPNTLFNPSDQAKEEGFSSWTFEKEVTSAKINGLLSGKITSYGDYCSVTVELRTYPGAKVMGTVTEVGMLGDLIPLANRISSGLAAKITNTLPVKIEFDVFPKEAADNLVVTVDGVVQQLLSKSKAGNDFENSILVNAGIHRIVIESADYETLSVLYSFTDENVFTVKADLVPDVKNEIHIRLKKYKDGIFYANGLDSAEVSEDNPYGTLTVNGKPALAVFKAAPAQTEISENSENENEESNLAFIQIPPVSQNSAFDGAYLVANAKPYDRAANIDHRRRMMYLAYSGLICSLPWTFYNLGNFTEENKAYSKDRTSYDNVVDWQKKTYISLGVTAVFGAWAVFELVRYLYAADKVLPVKAKIDKNSAKILNQIEENKSKMNPVIETVEPENQENLETEGSAEQEEAEQAENLSTDLTD